MREFADLFQRLDRTTRTNEKVEALASYLATASESDRLWTIALLSGRRPKRTVTAMRLREWAAEAAGIPDWLFEECYPVVGDLAETIALLLPPPKESTDHGLTHWIDEIRALAELDDPCKKERIAAAWQSLERTERLLFNKLITGGFRVGVSQKLMTRALSRATGIEEPELAHRLMGDWTPDSVTFETLVLAPNPAADLSKPYPFCLAYQLDMPPEDLGSPAEWSAEHKWDGIRAQLVLRGGEYFVWSRGEELITDRFPEFAQLLDFVPAGTVIDGEILAWRDGAPLPFSTLQRRIGRKSVSAKLAREVPVILCAYDILEVGGADLRDVPLRDRRARLDSIAAGVPEDLPFRVSPSLPFDRWPGLTEMRDTARDIGAEGLMLKRLESPYRGGRQKGDWWKWKVDPLTIDAVMVYAQAGHGRRATLFTDYTFAVRNGETWVPFTKAYSGLTDAEFHEITAWVRSNTLERFGPVRRVRPEHVFEIAFEGIQASSRHKCGVALRFPRMSRWRRDKPITEANTLDDLKAMLESYG